MRSTVATDYGVSGPLMGKVHVVDHARRLRQFLLLTPHGEGSPARSFGFPGSTAPPDPSWGRFTTIRRTYGASTRRPPDPSWGRFTPARGARMVRLVHLLTPHGEGSPGMGSGSMAGVEPPDPSWGRFTPPSPPPSSARYRPPDPSWGRFTCGASSVQIGSTTS